MSAYEALYRRTKNLPRYWRHRPPRKEISNWSEGFHTWYFDEAGGLCLSDQARLVYHEALNLMASISNSASPEEPLTVDEEERLWRAGQALRRQLAADLGTAARSAIRGDPPLRSGPAQNRIQ